MTFRIAVFLAFTIGVYGQSSTAIKGIKISSSTFDPQTRIVKVVFINDSSADITAYGVFIHKDYQNNQGITWTGSGAWGRDFLRAGAYDKIAIKKRSTLPAPSAQPIHPGQTAEETRDLSAERDLVSANIGIDMVAYSDGTAEVENEVTFRRLLISRHADLLGAHKAAEIGTSVLSHKHDPHPVATLIARLNQAKTIVPATVFQGPEAEGFARCWEESLELLIGELQKPGSGTYTDAITQAQPASSQGRSRERDRVRSFVEVQMQYAGIFARHTEIRRVKQ